MIGLGDTAPRRVTPGTMLTGVRITTGTKERRGCNRCSYSSTPPRCKREGLFDVRPLSQGFPTPRPGAPAANAMPTVAVVVTLARQVLGQPCHVSVGTCWFRLPISSSYSKCFPALVQQHKPVGTSAQIPFDMQSHLPSRLLQTGAPPCFLCLKYPICIVSVRPHSLPHCTGTIPKAVLHKFASRQ